MVGKELAVNVFSPIVLGAMRSRSVRAGPLEKAECGLIFWIGGGESARATSKA